MRTDERIRFVKQIFIAFLIITAMDLIIRNFMPLIEGDPLTYTVSKQDLAFRIIISILIAYLDLRKRRRKMEEKKNI